MSAAQIAFSWQRIRYRAFMLKTSFCTERAKSSTLQLNE
jgi:hypothetical protein